MIFIIDDDPSVQKAFSILLKAVGFDARAFPSAEEFLTHLSISDGDCIILDLRMPGTGGLDLIEKLASREIKAPVICVTAFDDAESREQARALGAVAFFTKPVDDQALIDAINWAVHAGEKRTTKHATQYRENKKMGKVR